MASKHNAHTLPLPALEFELKSRCPHIAEITKAINNEGNSVVYNQIKNLQFTFFLLKQIYNSLIS